MHAIQVFAIEKKVDKASMLVRMPQRGPAGREKLGRYQGRISKLRPNFHPGARVRMRTSAGNFFLMMRTTNDKMRQNVRK